VDADQPRYGRGFSLQRRRDLAPGLFPLSFMAHGRIGVYFEAAAVIIS
jgi:Cu+-exporting ATPase